MAHIPRLYLPQRFAPGPVQLDAEHSRRLASVMRLRTGDEFRLFSGDGREWRAVVLSEGKTGLRCEVQDVVRQEPRPARTIELWCGLVRPSRFDWAVEKAVEAGADVIRPLLSDYTARGDGASRQKHDRWNRIAIEAAEQSGRLWVPVIAEPARFGDLLARLRGPLVLADAGGMQVSEVARLLPPAGTVTLAVGPEGGFSPDELARARAAGALPLRLGPNILRTETAAVVATGLLRAFD